MLELVKAPLSTPVSLGTMKDHLRVDHGAEDTLIELYSKAAVGYIEKATGRALVSQQWKYYPAGWPCGTELQIPLPPLTAVASVKYYDQDNTQQTLSPDTGYELDLLRAPGKVVLRKGQSWPSIYQRVAPIEVAFTCGYTEALLPSELLQAYLMLTGHFYETRQTASAPEAVDNLLTPYRTWVF